MRLSLLYKSKPMSPSKPIYVLLYRKAVVSHAVSCRVNRIWEREAGTEIV